MFWNVRATPRAAISCGRRAVMSSSFPPSPRSTTWPWSAAVCPVRTFKSVVLPAPFGPMSPTMAPSGRSKETPSTARTPPKWRWTLRSVSRGAGTPADQPFGTEDGDDDQDDAIEDLAVIACGAEHFGKCGEEHRAGEGSGDSRRSADDREHEHEHGAVERVLGGGDEEVQ